MRDADFTGSIDPAVTLTRLLRSKTGAEIEPKVMRLFLAAHWTKVSRLAHAIHDQEVADA